VAEAMKSAAIAARVQLPMVPMVTAWSAQTPGTISLGQGMVGYGPPAAALARVAELAGDPAIHRYQPDPGMPELRRAFADKLARENDIDVDFRQRIVVTAGSNQAFLQALLCICDPGDEVILLSPYYFNHEMAIRLRGCEVVSVDTDSDYLPRPSAIAAAITPRTRALVTVSPNNPTGAVYPAELLAELNRLCVDRGIYHISDEAYEYFTYGGAEHFSPGSLGNDAHTITCFSLSKAYGYAGWRIGFIVVPEHLYGDLIKVQDTNAICAPAISQAVAVELLAIGRGYCDEQRVDIERVRDATLVELARVADLVTVPPAAGALYFFIRVATDMAASELAERLVREHRVAVIPGETFGMRDGCYLRVSYGAVDLPTAQRGLGRLTAGLRELVG
jgi:aspartate/methionine/tyrosine aminotransferase